MRFLARKRLNHALYRFLIAENHQLPGTFHGMKSTPSQFCLERWAHDIAFNIAKFAPNDGPLAGRFGAEQIRDPSIRGEGRRHRHTNSLTCLG
ncbi:hypothetical protein [Aliiroseovarius crassostreae]|uniref:hypothetical protein n=1 Tax=Aliiroseovarius crassostreae TaxID=154981 RepID=UPI003C7AA108